MCVSFHCSMVLQEGLLEGMRSALECEKISVAGRLLKRGY